MPGMMQSAASKGAVPLHIYEDKPSLLPAEQQTGPGEGEGEDKAVYVAEGGHLAEVEVRR